MTKTLRALALSLILSVIIPVLWSFGGYDGPARWQGNPTLTVTDDLALDNPFTVSDLAFHAWDHDSAGFTTGVKFVKGGEGHGNIHVTRGTFAKDAESIEHTMAEARMTYAPGTHYITSCTIVLSPEAFKSGRPLIPILTHEMGHCLGLGHEVHQGGTNMYRAFQWYQQGWKDWPTDWDQKNLRDLYSD